MFGSSFIKIVEKINDPNDMISDTWYKLSMFTSREDALIPSSS